MSTFVLTDATTWVHGYDFTGDSNQLAVTTEVDAQDSTTFGSGGWRQRKGGLKDVELEMEGFWDSAPDAQAFPDLGVIDRVHTLSPTGAESAVAYMFQAGKFEYEQLGSVGEMAPFTLNSMGSNGVGAVRGQVTKTKANVSTTGATGTALNLGAVAADEFLYATFHVFSAGTTITAVIESDDANTFLSPTTRISFTTITTTGGTWGVRVAGSITDTWYRLNVTAVTGTFSIASAVGIQ